MYLNGGAGSFSFLPAYAPDGRSIGLMATPNGVMASPLNLRHPIFQVMRQASGHSNGPCTCFYDQMVPTAMEAFAVTLLGHRLLARSARGTGRPLPMCLLASPRD